MVDTLALGVLEFDAGVTVVFEILGALVEFAFEASTSCIQHIKSNTNCSRWGKVICQSESKCYFSLLMIKNTEREIQCSEQEANVFEQMWIKCCEFCLWIYPLFHFNTLVWRGPTRFCFAGFRIPLWCNFNYMGREAVNLFPRGSICPPPRATDTATRSSVYEKEQDYNYPTIELVLK